MENQDKNQLFEELYKAYYTEIYRYVFFNVRQRVLAEDLVQDSFIKALNNIEKFDGKNPRAWLYQITKNTLIDNSRRFENRMVMKNSEFVSTVLSETSMEKEIENKDFYKSVLEKMDELKPDQKEAILLRYIENLEYDDIASIMNRTKEAVMILVSKGLKILRLQTEDERKLFHMSFIFIDTNFAENFENMKSNILLSKQMPSTENVTVNPVSNAAFTKIAIGITVAFVAIGGIATYLIANNSQKTATTNSTTPIVTTVNTTTVPTGTTNPTTTSNVVSGTTRTFTSGPEFNVTFDYPVNYNVEEKTVEGACTLMGQYIRASNCTGERMNIKRISINSDQKDSYGFNYGVTISINTTGIGSFCDVDNGAILKSSSINILNSKYNYSTCESAQNGVKRIGITYYSFNLKTTAGYTQALVSGNAKDQKMLDEINSILSSIR